MKNFYLIAIITFMISSCKVTNNPNEVIEIIDEYSQLEQLLDVNKDHVKVINFWATTCPPCRKEMPHFEQLLNEYGDKGVDVLLVSLDKPKDLEKRLIPFVEKYKIKPEVVLLGDDNYSAWTAKIDKSWFGALPATLIVKGDKRIFKFGMYLDYQSLKSDVDKVKG